MPGPLRYDQVAAPDFASSLAALQAAGSTLNSAVGAARSGVAGVEAIRNEDVAKDYALAMAKFTDPTEFQKAYSADPTLGVQHADRLTSGEIAGGAKQVSELLSAHNSLASSAQTDRQRTNSNLDEDTYRALTPEINTYLDMSRTDRGKAEEFRAGSKLNTLDPGRFNSLLDTAAGRRGTDLSTSGAERNFTRQGISDTRADVSYQNGLDVESLVNAAQGKVETPEEAIAYFNDSANRPQGMTDTAWNNARQGTIALVQQYGGLSAIPAGATGGAGGGGGAAGGGGDVGAPLGSTTGGKNAYDAVLGNGSYGPPPSKPVSQMSIGEAMNYGDTVLKPGSKAAGVGKLPSGKLVGSSAIGAYQIVGDTMRSVAPAVFGKDWQNVPMNAENQDKLGQYIFEHNKTTDGLQKQWASLTPETAAQAVKLSWDQAKHIIAKGESGALQANAPAPGTMPTAAQLQARQTTAQASVAVQQGNDKDLQVAKRFLAVAGDSGLSGKEVAAKMTAPGQVFAGEDPGNLELVINRTSNHFGVSQAVAGQMLLSASNGPKGSFRKAFTGKGQWFGSGLDADIDPQKLGAYAKFVHDPQALVDKVLGAQGTDTALAAHAAAASEFLNLAARFKQSALTRENRGMGPPAMPARLKQLLASASRTDIAAAGMNDVVAAGGFASGKRDEAAGRTVPVKNRSSANDGTNSTVRVALPDARPIDPSRPRVDWNHPSILSLQRK